MNRYRRDLRPANGLYSFDPTHSSSVGQQWVGVDFSSSYGLGAAADGCPARLPVRAD